MECTVSKIKLLVPVIVCAYVHVALEAANAAYSEKLQLGDTHSKVLSDLAWKVDELQTLVKVDQKLHVEVNTLSGKGKHTTALQLSSLRKQLKSFISDVYRQKRIPASHIFVLMISCEERNVKPYAIPIQCIPYSSINESTLRRIVCNVLRLMKSRGMAVAGMTYVCV